MDIGGGSFGSKVLAVHYRPGVGTNRTADGWIFTTFLPGGGCDVGRGGIGLSSLGIFDPSCSVN